jgi:benzoate membrane transport protein
MVLQRLFRDTSMSSLLAGVLTVLVGWAGPNVLIYSVQQAAGLSASTTWSWLWAHAIFTGVASIYLSLRSQQPILSTWSTPGIAFLVTALPGIGFAEAVGAFITSGALIVLLGLVKPLTTLLAKMPTPLAAALNAAILLPFALHAVTALGSLPIVVGAMILGYFLVRQVSQQWAVAAVLAIGIAVSAATGALHLANISFTLTQPEFVMPQFSLRATISLALPLTLIAFTGQFLPGFGVLKAQGYDANLNSIMRGCGVASIGAAFFGCHNLTLAALLANMVAGPDVHPALHRRYPAAVWAGVGNILVGLFAGTVLQLMAILPAPALAALAGLALASALGQSLTTAVAPMVEGRPGSLATATILAVTVSGFAPWGIGSAFWGIIAGLTVYALEGLTLPSRQRSHDSANATSSAPH